MQVPERFSVGTFAALIALAATGLGTGCATSNPVAIAWDQREDLSRFRTWDWIEGNAVLVRAAMGNEDELQAQLSALVATTLRERGLERAPGSGEIRVAALLVVHRTYQAITRTRALQTLHSNHDLGSYEVEAQELERRPLDRIRLSVYVTGAHQERLLWQGALDEQYQGGFAHHLDDAIETLLADFPPRAQAQK